MAQLTKIDSGPDRHGRLGHVLQTRGAAPDAEGPMLLDHRPALVYTLGKAAELEHLVLCQYLFAAFSLKREEREGLTPEQVDLVKGWHHSLMEIAEQEMLHLALVQNLLTAVGAAPHLARPNFPVPSRSFPAAVRMALIPFGEVGLRHFAFLERPEGFEMADADEFAAIEKAVPLPIAEEDQIGPHLQDFATIGHLYRSIDEGLAHLAEKLGADRLFIGPPSAQATEEHFRWHELVAVTDLESAHRAIETIVEQGEGARGDWRGAHFGRLISILDEYLAARAAAPGFEPTRPVVAALVREPESDLAAAVISEPFTIRCMDLLNAVYEVLLQMLSRYFAHTEETNNQLHALADVSVGLMKDVIKPLGGLVTQLAVGDARPGAAAGPSFELFFSVDYLLPHRDAAWTIMEERLREVAELATRCRDACIPSFLVPLSRITDALRRNADQLAAAHLPRER